MGVYILLGNPPPSPQALGCIKGAFLCSSAKLCTRIRLFAWHGLHESTAPFHSMLIPRFCNSPQVTGLYQGRCTVQRATPRSYLPEFSAYKGLTEKHCAMPYHGHVYTTSMPGVSVYSIALKVR